METQQKKGPNEVGSPRKLEKKQKSEGYPPVMRLESENTVEPQKRFPLFKVTPGGDKGKKKTGLNHWVTCVIVEGEKGIAKNLRRSLAMSWRPWGGETLDGGR